MIEFTKEMLYEHYIVNGETMREVAKNLGIATGTVHKYLKKYGIESRDAHKGMLGKKHSEESKRKMSYAQKGKVFSDEAKKKMSDAKRVGGIGRKKKRSDGYVAIYFPDHPKSNGEGFIMEHVLIMECLIGRHLQENEVVHHINFKRDDNRKENLQLMTASEHMSYHNKKRHEEKRRTDLSTK